VVPAFRAKHLQHFTFVIDGSQEIVPLAIDLHKDLIQLPTPLRDCTQTLRPFPSDLRSEHRTEAAPPEPHCLVADIDATLEQQILDLPQRERIADENHHRQADHFGRAVEITEGIVHPGGLCVTRGGLKPIWSDKAPMTSARASHWGNAIALDFALPLLK